MVNINDGSIGLTTVEDNVLFNGCRESHDHGNFNSWDRTPILHLSGDDSGVPTWDPGESAVSRNLLINAYGAGHGIDHDDGSMHWQDVSNVVAFSHACKGNFGSSRNCSANLVMAPGLKSSFGSTRDSGAPCAEQTNNGHGSSFGDKRFEGNTCVQAGGGAVPAYEFKSCDTGKAEAGPELGGTVWQTARNRFLVPKGTAVYVPCGKQKVPLEDWQRKYGQDAGATVEPLPPLVELVAQARALLGVREPQPL